MPELLGPQNYSHDPGLGSCSVMELHEQFKPKIILWLQRAALPPALYSGMGSHSSLLLHGSFIFLFLSGLLFQMGVFQAGQ